jgi:trimeric autotransporter adhesin
MENKIKSFTGGAALQGRAYTSTSHFLAIVVLSFIGITGFAQNASWNLNSIPVGGIDNSGFGFGALSVVTGARNTGVGLIALTSTTTGSNNTSIGVRTLTGNTTGSNNTGLGFTANVGAANLTNATAVGNGAVSNLSNKIRLGNAAVTVIEGQVAYTFPSDGRFKNNISESDVKGLDFINRLRPVVYNFDTRKFQEFLIKNLPEADRAVYLDTDFGPSTAVRQSGFIAQEVELAAKEVGYDFNGVHVPVNEDDNYSVAYAEFVVPLVKAVQEQQVMIGAQQQQIDELKKLVATLAGSDKNVGAEAANGVVAADIKMYPNPTGGAFTISTKQLQGGMVTVHNLAGEKIHQADLKGNATTHQVDLTSQPRGMYLVTITVNGKEITTQKMMLQ